MRRVPVATATMLLVASLSAGCATAAAPQGEVATTPPVPTPTETVVATPTTTPAVELTGAAVGDVAFGTQDPVSRLTELLGPPDEHLDASFFGDGACGSGYNTGERWGDLTVELDAGALWGWHVDGPDLPSVARLPHDVRVGDPVGALEPTLGPVEPFELASYGIWVVDDAAGTQWWAEAPGAEAPVVAVVGGQVATCD